jgi:collagenase-like PrtC family protease
MGVAAMKIEGRYKDEDYVALTTRAYRKAVDDAWAGRVGEDRARRKAAAGAGLFARARSRSF